MPGNDKKTGKTPEGTTAKPNGADARAERLAAALKANLKRRKAQTRGRTEAIGRTGKEEDSESGNGQG